MSGFNSEEKLTPCEADNTENSTLRRLRNLNQSELCSIAYQEYETLNPIGKELYSRLCKDFKQR